MTAEIIWDFSARRHAQREKQDRAIIEEVILASLSKIPDEDGKRALFTSSLHQNLSDKWQELHSEEESIIMLPCDSE